MRLKQSGQIVLITLLVLAIGTTVALSLIARTTTDTAISSQIEESTRAFAAAEAGIELALASGVGSGGTQYLTSGTSYTTTVGSVGGSAGVYLLDNKTPVGTTETVWFVNHDANGNIIEQVTYTGTNINLCWSDEDPVKAAVVATVLYKEKTPGDLYINTYKVVRIASDPDSARANTNEFNPVSFTGEGCGQNGFYKRNVTFNSAELGNINSNVDILLALRVRPVYAATQFAFDPGTFTIPLQGTRIESSGSTPVGVMRKVVVRKQYTSAPTIFDATIYSQSSYGH